MTVSMVFLYFYIRYYSQSTEIFYKSFGRAVTLEFVALFKSEKKFCVGLLAKQSLIHGKLLILQQHTGPRNVCSTLIYELQDLRDCGKITSFPNWWLKPELKSFC